MLFKALSCKKNKTLLSKYPVHLADLFLEFFYRDRSNCSINSKSYKITHHFLGLENVYFSYTSLVLLFLLLVFTLYDWG